MKKIAFVDIDTQFDFMKKKGRLSIRGAERIIPNLRKLTQFADKYKINIIASVDAHSVRDPEFKLFPAHCVKGKTGQKKIKETLLKNRVYVNINKRSPKELSNLLDRYRQIILEKKTIEVFLSPNIAVILKNIDTAFVYGVATDYCIKTVVLGLLKLNKKVFIVEDAIKAISVKEGNKVLKMLAKKGVKLIKTKTLIN
ncbi:MAG TPA: isochorismatase family cysteine hydrolase [Candidatus Omnitrophota bacterium]|nr:isochorismatase family cysteine hydrolase [Candidatus Omnitrophota bacterium]